MNDRFLQIENSEVIWKAQIPKEKFINQSLVTKNSEIFIASGLKIYSLKSNN